MRTRRKKSMRRGIMLTPQANAYLNARAEELGISGAEYSRRMMFLESWRGLVFDDCRAIEEAAAADARQRQGLPMEDYLPYKRNVLARLRRGEEEIRALRRFVLESVLPRLDEDEAKILAARQQEEAEMGSMLGWIEIQHITRKLAGREDADDQR